MSIIDAALPVCAILLALIVAMSNRATPKVAGGAFVLLAALCVVQWRMAGFYWHLLLTYLLVSCVGLLALARRRPGGRRGFAVPTGIGVLSLLAAAPWTFTPVPGLLEPQGPYAVGTQVFRWVDPSRAETATAAATDRRNIVVQAWYPAEPGGTEAISTYIDGLGQLPGFVSLIPGVAMAHYDRVDTNGLLGAKLSSARQRWPVVLFSPGYGAPRAFYTGLVSDLASRGFVVLAVDHPYEAAVTELANGRIATPIERFLENDPDRLAYMSQQLDKRAADLRFVIDQLDRPGVWGEQLSGRLDSGRIAAIGHSFGGATAVAAMAQDGRIKAAANIDGTLYGSLAEQQLRRPLLLIESDHSETGHSEQYLQGNQRLTNNLRAAGFRYEIEEANHYSFTDAPLFFSYPARLVLAQLIGGSRGAKETQQATNDLLAAFLQGPLGGEPGDIETIAARHADIHGGPVRDSTSRIGTAASLCTGVCAPSN